MSSLMDAIYNECLHIDPHSKLRRGGSQANGFHLSGSDLNVSWETCVEDALPRLQARGVFAMMPWRHGARVEKHNSGFATITVNDTGMQFTAEMLSRYSWMADVRVFVRTVKRWACDCCPELSGYVATLLALHFCVQAWKVPCLEALQQHDDVLQCRVEATPLQSFFEYFRNFNFEEYAICCRSKNLVLRKHLAPPSLKSTQAYVRGPLVDDCSSFDLDAFLGALNAPWEPPKVLTDEETDENDAELKSDLQSLWCIHNLLVKQFVPSKPEGCQPALSKSHRTSPLRPRLQQFQRRPSPPPDAFPLSQSPTPAGPAMSGTVNFPSGPVRAVVTPAYPALFAQQQSGTQRVIGPPSTSSPRPAEDPQQGLRATQQWECIRYSSPSTPPTTALFPGARDSFEEWLSKPMERKNDAKGQGKKGQKGQGEEWFSMPSEWERGAKGWGRKGRKAQWEEWYSQPLEWEAEAKGQGKKGRKTQWEKWYSQPPEWEAVAKGRGTKGQKAQWDSDAKTQGSPGEKGLGEDWFRLLSELKGDAGGQGAKGQKGHEVIPPNGSPTTTAQGSVTGTLDKSSPQTQPQLRIEKVKLEKSLLLDVSLEARETDELGGRYKNAWLVKVAPGSKDGFRTVRALPSKVLLTGGGGYSFTVGVKKTLSSFLNVGVCEWFVHDNEADSAMPGTILDIPAAATSDAAQRNGENNPKGYLVGCRRGVRAFAADSGCWDTEPFVGSDILAGSIIEFQVRPEDGGFSLYVDPTEMKLRKERKWERSRKATASPWEKIFSLPHRRYVPVCTLFSGDDEVLLAF